MSEYQTIEELVEASDMEKKIADKVIKAFKGMSKDEQAKFMKAYLKNPDAAVGYMFSQMKKMTEASSMDGMCCKNCGDEFGKPKSESCMYDAYDMKGENWIKKESYNEELDPVNKAAVKKKFADRKDKDIDNDGDVDSSDEYLHKRRKAISKALDEVLDTPEKMDSYRNKAKASKERAAKSAVATSLRSKNKETREHPAKDLKTIAKRTAGEKMADRNAARKFRKMNKEEVELDESRDLKQPGPHPLLTKAGIKHVHKQSPFKKSRTFVTVHNKADYEKAKKVLGNNTVVNGGNVYLELEEAKSDYTINHKTFSSAVQHAKDQVEKQGYTIDDDEWDRKVAMGPRKPGTGKTNRYTIDLMKNGKETRKKLQMQVYYDEGRYELNMYVS